MEEVRCPFGLAIKYFRHIAKDFCTKGDQTRASGLLHGSWEYFRHIFEGFCKREGADVDRRAFGRVLKWFRHMSEGFCKIAGRRWADGLLLGSWKILDIYRRAFARRGVEENRRASAGVLKYYRHILEVFWNNGLEESLWASALGGMDSFYKGHEIS